MVAESAFAIGLLVGAGLLVRSWRHVNSIDPGFRPERVLAMELSAPTAFSGPAQLIDLYDRVLEQIQAVPGVRAPASSTICSVITPGSTSSLSNGTAERCQSACG